ncbi:MAG: hypothetical protein KA184_10085 [Candidatus Hydrogenedentes bacterium]|nr:hypothetical protein [Candidatus Hydrogenedentota bacterium]
MPRQYPTIQAAINAAKNGDEIVVSRGRYVENIHMLGKNVVLRSTNPRDLATVEATIIDGNEAGTVITFLGMETTACVVTGFTITNGFAHQGGGFHGSNGEVFSELDWAQPTIESNIIRNNRCGSYTELVFSEGAGVYRCLGVIRDNIIIENEALGLEICDDWPDDCDYERGLGGGIFGCGGLIENNLIAYNIANYYSAVDTLTAVIRRNIITGNIGTTCVASGSGSLEENLIADNTIGSHSGAVEHFSGDILNNVIVGNTGFGLFGVASEGRVEGNYISKNMNSVSEGNYQIWGADHVWRNAIIGTRSDRLVRVMQECTDVRYNVILNNASSWRTAFIMGHCQDVVGNLVCNNDFTGDSRSLFTVCTGIFYNNTVVGNSVGYADGLFDRGPDNLDPDPDIRNCIFWDNTTPTGALFYDGLVPTYSCIENDTSGEPTNISLDPGFVDPEHGDFSLRPDSPCIDAGAYVPEAATDIVGRARGFDGSPEPRGDGSDFDIGAYEFVMRIIGEGEGEGEGGPPTGPHSADRDGDWRIAMSELLRVIQFYNAHGYHCDATTEDGYAPGPDGGLAQASESSSLPRHSCSEGGGDVSPSLDAEEPWEFVNPLEVKRSPFVEAYMRKHGIKLPEIPEEHIKLWRAWVTRQHGLSPQRHRGHGEEGAEDASRFSEDEVRSTGFSLAEVGTNRHVSPAKRGVACASPREGLRLPFERLRAAGLGDQHYRTAAGDPILQRGRVPPLRPRRRRLLPGCGISMHRTRSENTE